MSDKVAVILPVYIKDKSEYLILAVESILKQSYTDLILLIGVDGPVDETLAELLHLYEAKDNVEVHYFQENRGLAIVLNDLIKICEDKGIEFIGRMDADDISTPDRFAKQMTFLLENPDVDVVGGAIEEIDESGNFRHKQILYPESPEECKKFFSRRNPLAHPAVLFRHHFFKKAGCYYRPEYRQNQDTLLWYDGLMKRCNLANIPDVVLHFRMTEGLLKKRRSGIGFAKKQLSDRKMINKGLGYGFKANVFAYAMFLLMVSPTSIRKLAYRLFR